MTLFISLHIALPALFSAKSWTLILIISMNYSIRKYFFARKAHWKILCHSVNQTILFLIPFLLLSCILLVTGTNIM